ncbi:MAG: NAD(P)-dependent oxidoreductase [Planctomycetota bacterium]
MSSPQHLGYIGLGIMGASMAMNLRRAGHRLTVWNRTPAKAEALIAAGAERAEGPADVVRRGAEVVFLNVTDTNDVEAVLFGGDGVASASSPGLVVVDHSTISPVRTKQFAERLRDEHGVTFIDAPVSGGDIGARDGTLSVMVGGPGGPGGAVERVRPLLEVVGRAVTHVGPSGAGQACKACNQVAVCGALLGAVEALALAQSLGLDAEKMLGVVGAGAGGSWQLSNLGPQVAAGDHTPGFFVDYLLKDLGIVGDAARAGGLPLMLVPVMEALLRSVSANGGGSLGTQAVATAYEQLGGFTFAGDGAEGED